MITVDLERCTGCGACLEVCPTGALYLVDGKAVLDSTLCCKCEACLAACPCGAITLATPDSPGPQAIRAPALLPEGPALPASEVVRVTTLPAPQPWRSRALPMVSAALGWAGREILPWLADVLLDTVDRQTNRLSTKGTAGRRPTATSRTKGGSRQHRHRRRGGS